MSDEINTPQSVAGMNLIISPSLPKGEFFIITDMRCKYCLKPMNFRPCRQNPFGNVHVPISATLFTSTEDADKVQVLLKNQTGETNGKEK